MFIINLLVMCLVFIFLDIVEPTSKTQLVVSEIGRIIWRLVLFFYGGWNLWGNVLTFFLNYYSFDKVAVYFPSLQCSNLFG